MTPRLEGWKLVEWYDGIVLVGQVFDDNRFMSGTTITTSPVLTMDANNTMAKTRTGTVYLLGLPDQPTCGLELKKHLR